MAGGMVLGLSLVIDFLRSAMSFSHGVLAIVVSFLCFW
jgi:hypothetical protein